MNDKLLKQIIGGVALLMLLLIVIRWFNTNEAQTNTESALPLDPQATETSSGDGEARVYAADEAAASAATENAVAENAQALPSDNVKTAKKSPEVVKAPEPVKDDLSDELAAAGTPAIAPVERKAKATNQPAQAKPEAASLPAATPATNKPANARAKGTHLIQVGSYSNSTNAEGLVKTLKARGYPVTVEEAAMEGKKIFRVRVGPYDEATAREQASLLQAELKQSVFVFRR